ncbi:MAG: NUDIX hydrolase [Candidatus Puniceispirillaceae bacterium]
MDHKIGVIPFDISGENIAIMFVTSQRRGRWILPKGNLKPDESHKKGCKREAFEEAGIKGRILTDFPMTHVVTKSNNGAVNQVAVTYYPMLVLKQFDDWPEQPKRKRHWALLDDAPRVTDGEDFRLVINQFAAIKPLILKTAKCKKA